MEMMAGEGIPFFLFQSHAFSLHHAGKEVSKNPKGRMAGWIGSKRTYLMKRLSPVLESGLEDISGG